MRQRGGLSALVTLAILLAPTPSAQQAGRTLYVNHTDPTCQGQSPCYPTIQAAVDAVQPGSVVIRGAVSQCTNGHAIRLSQSKFITLRGLTITGAGGQAISLLGGNNQNQAIHIERNRLLGNGSSECNGGITIARGNPDTLIVNNLIYANGRNGITFIDADGGPHYLVQNTIHANAWSGVSIARSHEVVLVNNVITQNGTASGSTGGRVGVKREGATSPEPEGIQLLHNLICGNRLGEIDGPALDATDAHNLTPTGAEGPGVLPSPGCELPATVYADLNGPDGLPHTADDDFTLAPGSPAIDQGIDPRTLGLDLLFQAGLDRTVPAGTILNLDGSASFDPDGDPITFQWSQIAGPPVTLSAPTSATPVFIAPPVATQTGLTFQLQVSDGRLSSTDTVTITVTPLLQITITAPADGAIVLTPIALVQGTIESSAPEVGVVVNGVLAQVSGLQFAALVPLVPGSNPITATATDTFGNIATATITVTGPEGVEPPLLLTASPPSGVAPLTVAFSALSLLPTPIATIELDLDGNGTIDFRGVNLEGQAFTYSQPGLYLPTVTVTDAQGTRLTASTLVQVYDQTALDTLLQAKWTALKDALRVRDIARAITLIHTDTRAAYEAQLTRFSPATLANIDRYMTTIQLIEVGPSGAQYEMLRERNGQVLSFAVWFQVDGDGLWRLRRF